MLVYEGVAGIKKVYYDPGLRRQVSLFVPAEDVIIPYGSSGARTAERVTHLMRKTKNDVKKLQVSGFYRDVDLGEPVQIHTDVEKKKAEEKINFLQQKNLDFEKQNELLKQEQNFLEKQNDKLKNEFRSKAKPSLEFLVHADVGKVISSSTKHPYRVNEFCSLYFGR